MGFPTTAGSLAVWVDQNAAIPGSGTPVNKTELDKLINEINAITNTLGASALALSNLAEDPATTTALIWGWQAGRVVEDNVVSTVAASSIAITNNATNYIEYSASTATMYTNTSAFTTGRKPIAKVITSGGFITGTVASRDQRTWLNVFSGTALAAAGSYTITGAWSFSNAAGLAFTTKLISTTALATPSALSATQFTGFASTVSGAAIMGFGTTNDVSLMNRAGTVCLGVGPNTTVVNIPGSLTSATINAFTLAGTVAGGGNQINNVIIGTTTPLAGAFTTVVATSLALGGVLDRTLTVVGAARIGDNAGHGLFFRGASAVTNYNWQIGNNVSINKALEFTPSTVVGGTTFSTPVFTILADTGAITTTGTINTLGPSTTGTGSLVGSAAPTFTTSIIAPLIIGGTGTTSTLSLQTTSGVGASGANMRFLVGNNGGTEAMTILNSGLVGIGTAAPGTKLDIQTSGTTAYSATALSTAANDSDLLNLYNVSNSSTFSSILFGSRTSGGSFGRIVLQNPASADGASNFAFLLRSAAASGYTTEVMRIMSTGNVGIATTAPSTLLHVGLAGTTQGTIGIAGVTSGLITITTASAAGTYTLTLPPGANSNAGYQLTCAAGDTITTWAAAASRREHKNIVRMWDNPAEALRAVLHTSIYDFRYKKDVGIGTGDYETLYTGPMADEAPWAMHHDGGVVNPINTLGYAILAIQALNAKITALQARLDG